MPPRGPAANGPLAPMFGGLGGPPGPMGPMGFYPAAMGPQPPRGPGGELAPDNPVLDSGTLLIGASLASHIPHDQVCSQSYSRLPLKQAHGTLSLFLRCD